MTIVAFSFHALMTRVFLTMRAGGVCYQCTSPIRICCFVHQHFQHNSCWMLLQGVQCAISHHTHRGWIRFSHVIWRLIVSPPPFLPKLCPVPETVPPCLCRYNNCCPIFLLVGSSSLQQTDVRNSCFSGNNLTIVSWGVSQSTYMVWKFVRKARFEIPLLNLWFSTSCWCIFPPFHGCDNRLVGWRCVVCSVYWISRCGNRLDNTVHAKKFNFLQ